MAIGPIQVDAAVGRRAVTSSASEEKAQSGGRSFVLLRLRPIAPGSFALEFLAVSWREYDCLAEPSSLPLRTRS